MTNLVLAAVVVAVAYLWARLDFATPTGLRLSKTAVRRLTTIAGCLVFLVTGGYAIGSLVSGRTEIARTSTYARRDSEPARFWQQVLSEAGLGLTVGAALVLLARRRSIRHAAHDASYVASSVKPMSKE